MLKRRAYRTFKREGWGLDLFDARSEMCAACGRALTPHCRVVRWSLLVDETRRDPLDDTNVRWENVYLCAACDKRATVTLEVADSDQS